VYLSQDDSEAANGYTEEELAVQTRHPIAGYLNMTKTMIGAGILALPSAFNKVQYSCGVLLHSKTVRDNRSYASMIF
jgi:hypothetical protein